jgi:hypothetical protein
MITIIAVVSVNVCQNKTNTHCQLFGYIEPLALIVYGPDGKYVLDMDAKPVNYDQLRQDVPELKDITALKRDRHFAADH